MLREFKAFILKENVLALAIAVVLGTAFGKVVTAVVDDFVMPIVGAVTPGGSWQKATLDAGPVKFGIGDFLSVALNFLIVGFVVWRVSKAFVREQPPPAGPLTKPCPYCRVSIDPEASRCPHCTSDLGTLGVAATSRLPAG